MAALGCASLINKVNLSQNPQLPTNQPLNLTCHAHGQRHLQVHVQRTKFFTGKTHLVVHLTLPVINNGARRHCCSCSALFALCNIRPTPSRASFVPAIAAPSRRGAARQNLSCAAMTYTHAPVPMISRLHFARMRFSSLIMVVVLLCAPWKETKFIYSKNFATTPALTKRVTAISNWKDRGMTIAQICAHHPVTGKRMAKQRDVAAWIKWFTDGKCIDKFTHKKARIYPPRLRGGLYCHQDPHHRPGFRDLWLQDPHLVRERVHHRK